MFPCRKLAKPCKEQSEDEIGSCKQNRDTSGDRAQVKGDMQIQERQVLNQPEITSESIEHEGAVESTDWRTNKVKVVSSFPVASCIATSIK